MGDIRSIPHITVIMPVFNGRHFIEEAVRSVINQTFKSFELLIIDDGSVDSSWEIIQKLQAEYPRFIRSFKLSSNGGAFKATNYALRFARGEFIALMDCDDISHPERFQRQIKFFKENPDVAILGTQAVVINQNGEVIGYKKVPKSHDEIYKEFGVLHPMIHPSCMIRKRLLSGRSFKYLIKYGVNDDYYTFFTLLNKEKFANLNERLLFYRIHMNNSSLKDIKRKFFNSLKIRFEAFKHLNYRMDNKSLLMILMQIGVMLTVPERVTFYIYLVYKKIVPIGYIFNIIPSPSSINIKMPKFFTSSINSEI